MTVKTYALAVRFLYALLMRMPICYLDSSEHLAKASNTLNNARLERVARTWRG